MNMDPEMLATGLYGTRAPKNTPVETSSSSSLAFTSTLSSLLSAPPPPRAAGRPRPSKSKPDIFTSHNRNAKKRAARDLLNHAPRSTAQKHKSTGEIGDVDGETLKRSRRKLEEKARQYKALKRGDFDGDEQELVDFDRKWVEGEEESDVESGMEDGTDEIVDYEDEYGRAVRGTRADVERMERKKKNKLRGAEELDRMSARPVMPKNLIYGDTVQTEAFNPEEETLEKMQQLAKKRDRSATPPPQQHYEADKEFRIKGVGFYTFSKDEGIRMEEMEALEKERLKTERVRAERDEKKEKRKREIEERRRVLGEKRAKKQADNFLDGLTADLGEPSLQ